MKRKVLSICVCTIICILSNACSFGYKESDGIKTTESISETEELETSKTTEEAADITQPKYPIQINETGYKPQENMPGRENVRRP